jgi:Cu(I)/Ag(I) efflux system membrane fusion protein
MSGSWTLRLTVISKGASASLEYGLTVGRKGLTVASSREQQAGGQEMPGSLALPPQQFPPPVLAALKEAFGAYEKVRKALVADELSALPTPAARLAMSLRSAVENPSRLAGQTPAVIEEAARAADSLGVAPDLETARATFGEISRFLLLLANCDPRLGEGWQVFACPMTPTFEKWMQPDAELENPYMGQAMPACGTESDWSATAPATLEEVTAHAEHAHGGEISHYTCSMHPSVQKNEPGTCPICSMNLVPVTREEVETGIIRIDSQRRQQIGVRTRAVQTETMDVTIRAVGKVVYDETRLADVTIKLRGWIGRLAVDEPGQRVSRGETLFTLYSPELYAAQEELLAVLASQRAARDSSAPERADYLVKAARQRLRLWDLTEAQIDRVAESGEAIEYLPIVSPVSGHVIEKNVVAGAAVEPGQVLYRIAGLDQVWIEAEVYEADLPLIEIGQKAEITLPYLPGKRLAATVAFLYPYLEGKSRTGRVRLKLANPGLELKPEMYADVVLRAGRGERLLVPEEAVLYAGPRRLVFLDLGEGRLRPQEIEIGAKAGDQYEVLAGLEVGDVVVTSGNFLVAAESRLKSATEQW